MTFNVSAGCQAFPHFLKLFVAKFYVYSYRGCVFEEEDFQPLVYGFKLASEVTEQRAGGMLREVEDEIQKVLRKPIPLS